MYQRAEPISKARAYLSGLSQVQSRPEMSARERECLEQAMTKLAHEARSFIQKEKLSR